jgi:hypothetical protein
MAGKMWVESVPGTGSAFHFTASFETSGQPPAVKELLLLADQAQMRVQYAVQTGSS